MAIMGVGGLAAQPRSALGPCGYSDQQNMFAAMTRSQIQEPSFRVLAALASGPKHGYAVLQEIAAGGGAAMRAGTLYAALDRLTAEGLVTQAGEEVVDGRLRRYYDLTDDGVQTLAAETRRLRANVTAAAAGLRLRGVTA